MIDLGLSQHFILQRFVYTLIIFDYTLVIFDYTLLIVFRSCLKTIDKLYLKHCRI